MATGVGGRIVTALCVDVKRIEEDPEANVHVVAAGVRAAIACAVYVPRSVVAPDNARSLGKRSKEAVQYSLNNRLEQAQLGIGDPLHALAAFGALDHCQHLAWLFE